MAIARLGPHKLWTVLSELLERAGQPQLDLERRLALQRRLGSVRPALDGLVYGTRHERARSLLGLVLLVAVIDGLVLALVMLLGRP